MQVGQSQQSRGIIKKKSAIICSSAQPCSGRIGATVAVVVLDDHDQGGVFRVF